MDRSPMRDFIVGLFVLAGLGAIAWLSFSIGGFAQSKSGLILKADFGETGLLAVHAPVTIGGVRVGEVTNITLEGDHFRAIVTLNVDPSLKLSTDTYASIVTAGLLGDRLIELKPGGEEQLLKSGDHLTHNTSAVTFEDIIAGFMYGQTKDSKTPGTAPAKPPINSPSVRE